MKKDWSLKTESHLESIFNKSINDINFEIHEYKSDGSCTIQAYPKNGYSIIYDAIYPSFEYLEEKVILKMIEDLGSQTLSQEDLSTLKENGIFIKE